MLIGVKRVYSEDGSSYLESSFEGSKKEIEDINKSIFKSKEHNNKEDNNNDFYNPQAEEEYNNFIEEFKNELEDLDTI